ncbi:MAG: DciA family protein [Phycisphaerales bacterium]
MREDLQLVARLRALRTPPERDLSVAGPIARAASELKRRATNLGALGPAFDELVPPALRARAHLEGLRRGVLTVRCADSAARYELDRWLRGGGEISLIRRSGARLTRVRATV